MSDEDGICVQKYQNVGLAQGLASGLMALYTSFWTDILQFISCNSGVSGVLN